MCDAIARIDQPAFNPEAISTRSPTVSILRITRPVTPPPVLLRRYDTALALGLGIGVAYGIWAASGVALTAVASKFLFKEPFTWVMALGIALIIGGVLLVELGAAH